MSSFKLFEQIYWQLNYNFERFNVFACIQKLRFYVWFLRTKGGNERGTCCQKSSTNKYKTLGIKVQFYLPTPQHNQQQTTKGKMQESSARRSALFLFFIKE